MADWLPKGNARYGPAKFLTQTNCDFIDDNTCVSVNTVEASGETGEPLQYKSVFLATRDSVQNNILLKARILLKSVCGP